MQSVELLRTRGDAAFCRHLNLHPSRGTSEGMNDLFSRAPTAGNQKLSGVGLPRATGRRCHLMSVLGFAGATHQDLGGAAHS
jgi:hypothetical protein